MSLPSMFKTLVPALILANVLFWGWSQNFFAPWWPTHADQREPERLDRQVDPQGLQLLTPAAARERAAALHRQGEADSTAVEASNPAEAGTQDLKAPVGAEPPRSR